jgi:hypothetical protein
MASSDIDDATPEENMTRTSFLLALFVALAACTAAPPPPAEGEGEGQACTAMTPGTWAAGGTAFGMDMTTTTAFADCTATFTQWSMAMSTPAGATVAGTDVAFTGDGWPDCTGTLSDDGRSIAGECSDGTVLTMSAQ